jgi:hypothetical protein
VRVLRVRLEPRDAFDSCHDYQNRLGWVDEVVVRHAFPKERRVQCDGGLLKRGEEGCRFQIRIETSQGGPRERNLVRRESEPSHLVRDCSRDI